MKSVLKMSLYSNTTVSWTFEEFPLINCKRKQSDQLSSKIFVRLRIGTHKNASSENSVGFSFRVEFVQPAVFDGEYPQRLSVSFFGTWFNLRSHQKPG